MCASKRAYLPGAGASADDDSDPLRRKTARRRLLATASSTSTSSSTSSSRPSSSSDASAAADSAARAPPPAADGHSSPAAADPLSCSLINFYTDVPTAEILKKVAATRCAVNGSLTISESSDAEKMLLMYFDQASSVPLDAPPYTADADCLLSKDSHVPIAVLKLCMFGTKEYALCAVNKRASSRPTLALVPTCALDLGGPKTSKLIDEYRISRRRPYQLAVPHCNESRIEIPQYEEVTDLICGGKKYTPIDEFLCGCDCESGVRGGCNKYVRPAKLAKKADDAENHHPHEDRNECICFEFGPSYHRNSRLKNIATNQIIECNMHCKCDDSCANRVVQIQSNPLKSPILSHLLLRHVPEKGWSVFTTVDIPRGSFITQYLGDLLTTVEMDTRMEEYRCLGLNTVYSFDIDQFEDQAEVAYTIDALYRGNISRFFNHSCAPNLFVKTVFYDMPVSAYLARIAFFAYRDIVASEELTFDYEGKLLSEPSKEGSQTPKKPSNKSFSFACCCGTSACRKHIFS